MRINVRDLLAESVGYNRTYKITGERPNFENLRLDSDLEGEVTISRLDSGLLVRGKVSGDVQAECHRCLRSFSRPTSITYSQMYAASPDDDEFPIEGDEIDLGPSIEQELILAQPIKQLHSPDCRGIQAAGAGYTKDDSGTSLKHQARITKGPKRGRT
jgi:uncharacterized metal-binding protein YceD (DUF177 family)